MYTNLDDLITNSGKSLEIKRAIAVKQDIANKQRKDIASILEVSLGYISKWRLIYDEYGVDGLISTHQGGSSRAFLTLEKRSVVIAYIKSHELFSLADLVKYLKEVFEVKYKSMQSYYDLLHEANMSWHKSQKTNPRRDESKVLQRREEIKKNSVKRRKPSKRVK